MKRKANLSPLRKYKLKLPLTPKEHAYVKHYFEDHNRKYSLTPAKRARKLFLTAKKTAVENDLPFNLTLEWVQQKVGLGLCEVSGLPLDFSPMPVARQQNPFAPSLDRNIPELGYVMSNVRVVVWLYNVAKSYYSHETLIKLCKALIQREHHE